MNHCASPADRNPRGTEKTESVLMATLPPASGQMDRGRCPFGDGYRGRRFGDSSRPSSPPIYLAAFSLNRCIRLPFPASPV